MWRLYQPRRFAFLAPDAEGAAARLTPEGVEASVQDLKRRLASPLSGLITRVAPEDPMLVLPTLFESLQGNQGESHAGWFQGKMA